MRIRQAVLFAALTALGLSLAACGAARAGPKAEFDAVPVPTTLDPADVVLTVSGRLAAGAVTLGLPTLRAFPSVTFSARDPWDGAEHRYRGVLLAPLLDRLGMDKEAEYLDIVAANDYRVPILTADLRANGYLLAYEMDGRPPLAGDESSRRRGQLQIVVDWSAHPELEVEVYKSQLVWQVIRIEVR